MRILFGEAITYVIVSIRHTIRLVELDKNNYISRLANNRFKSYGPPKFYKDMSHITHIYDRSFSYKNDLLFKRCSNQKKGLIFECKNSNRFLDCTIKLQKIIFPKIIMFLRCGKCKTSQLANRSSWLSFDREQSIQYLKCQFQLPKTIMSKVMGVKILTILEGFGSNQIKIFHRRD